MTEALEKTETQKNPSTQQKNQWKRDFHKNSKRLRWLKPINTVDLEVNAPYLAGLLDGEGTFTILTKSTPPKPLVEICMTHEETIAFAAEVFGVSYSKVNRLKPHKDVYAIRIHTQKEIQQIANALLPYSKTKQEQIHLLLKWFELREELAKNTTDMRIRERMADLCIEIKKRNQRGNPPDYTEMRTQLLLRLQKWKGETIYTD